MSNDALPHGWVATTLGNVLNTVVGGGTPSRNIPAYFNGHIPWFTVKDMKVLKPNDAQEHITDKAIAESATNLIPANTLIVATRIALGKAIRPTVTCAINQDLKALMLSSGMNSDFMLHWIGWNERVIQDLGSGTTVSGIRLETLHALKLDLPPSEEQNRIVDKLEELLSDLDDGVNELKAAQKKLGQYRQSLLKAAVEGGLTADWRSKNKVKETGTQLLQRILKERRTHWETKQIAKYKEQNKTPPIGWKEKYPEPVKPDTTGLPELPKSWMWASAEQLCDFITKGTTPTKGISGVTEKTIPFLRVTNLTDTGQLDMEDKVFVTDEIHRGFLERSMVYPNDVLMNIVGPPLGQVSLVPNTYPEWNINQAIAIYRGVPGVLHGYLACCLLSPSMQNWLKARSKTTAGQTNLTLEVCRNLPIPLPPVTEQQALVKIFENHLNATKEQISVTEFSLKQSSAQRKNILKTAFSGQLVPQNPNDEPASVLLERIRAERAVKVSPSKKAVTQKIKTAKSKRVDQ